MANYRGTEHEQKHTEPPAASGVDRDTMPGRATEGTGTGRAMQERQSLLTKEETDAEAEAWDQKKDVE